MNVEWKWLFVNPLTMDRKEVAFDPIILQSLAGLNLTTKAVQGVQDEFWLFCNKSNIPTAFAYVALILSVNGQMISSQVTCMLFDFLHKHLSNTMKEMCDLYLKQPMKGNA